MSGIWILLSSVVINCMYFCITFTLFHKLSLVAYHQWSVMYVGQGISFTVANV